MCVTISQNFLSYGVCTTPLLFVLLLPTYEGYSVIILKRYNLKIPIKRKISCGINLLYEDEKLFGLLVIKLFFPFCAAPQVWQEENIVPF